MSENTKSSEVILGETVAHALTPVLEKMTESIKSVVEANAEAKSTKEAFEAKSAEMQANFTKEIEGDRKSVV